MIVLIYIRLNYQVRKMADETGLDFSDQINMLENKYQQVCLKIIDFVFLHFCHHIRRKRIPLVE